MTTQQIVWAMQAVAVVCAGVTVWLMVMTLRLNRKTRTYTAQAVANSARAAESEAEVAKIVEENNARAREHLEQAGVDMTRFEGLIGYAFQDEYLRYLNERIASRGQS